MQKGVFFLFLLFPATVYPAEGRQENRPVGIDFTVTPFPSTEYTCLWFEVSNSNDTAFSSLSLQVDLPSPGNPSYFRRTFDLPARGTRRFSLASPDHLRGGFDCRISIRDNAGKEIVSRRDHLGDLVFSTICITGPTANVPLFIRSNDHTRVMVAQNLPDQWRALAGISTIIICDTNLSDFSDSQITAICQWIALGGHLIFSPGIDKNAFSHPLLREVAPVDSITTLEVIHLPNFESFLGRIEGGTPFVIYRLSNGVWVVPDGEGDWEIPSAYRFRYGRGQACILPFDISRAPLSRWDGLITLFGRLGAFDNANHIYFNNVESSFFPRLVSKVNLLHVVVILFLFIVLLIGNYLLLKRWRMAALNVVTIPILSVLSFLLIIGAGYLIKGITVKTQNLHIIMPIEGSRYAIEERLFTVNSPSDTTVDVGFDQSILPIYERHYDRAGPSCSGIVEDDNGIVLKSVVLRQWEDVSIKTVAIREWRGTVRSKATGGEKEVEIQNSIPYDINAIWVANGHWARDRNDLGYRGRIPHGATTTVAMRVDEAETFSAENRVDYIGGGSEGPFDPVVFYMVDIPPSSVSLNGNRVSGQNLVLLVGFYELGVFRRTKEERRAR